MFTEGVDRFGLPVFESDDGWKARDSCIRGSYRNFTDYITAMVGLYSNGWIAQIFDDERQVYRDGPLESEERAQTRCNTIFGAYEKTHQWPKNESLEEDFKTSIKRFKDQGAPDDEITDYITDFKLLKPKIQDATKKDIDKWKTWAEFKAFVDETKASKSKSQEKKEKKASGAKLVAEDKYWKVYHITTKEAAMLYGSGTKWCITEPEQDYFEDYSKSNDFYFYISKRLSPSSPFYKIALQHGHDDSYTYWDATDAEHGENENRFRRGNKKTGDIPFSLPDVPSEHIHALKMKRVDDEPMHTIFLNPDSEITQAMRDAVLKLEPEAFIQVGPSGEADHVNLHTNDEGIVKKVIQILGSDMVAEVAPELTT
jgi:hypothetical protein